jgi:1,4-dihydroxy-2-naphthoate octaprenyltransferase
MVTLEPAPVGNFQAWLLAARPRTLPVAVAPVLVGSAVAAAGDGARLGPALAALSGALLLQITSNLANDVFDYEHGADGDDRIGPPRACQMGWLSPHQMRLGILVVLLLALVIGVYLTAVAGWPVVVAGGLSIGAALTYTGGPWPFGYKGLGEVAVFLFFGVVAVVGTDYVQTLRWSWPALGASCSVGVLAAAILVVNNLRDIDSDRAAGKITLAVRLGVRGARWEYNTLLGIAYAAPWVYWLLLGCSGWVMLPLLTLPMAIRLIRTVNHCRDGEALNTALAETARLTLLFSALLALGWLV